MFGYAAFAQPAFAALGGSFYVLSITEAINVLAATNGGRPYADTVIEAFTAGDLPSVVALFSSVVSEAILSDYDAEAVIATFITFITEALSVANAQTALVSFVSGATENINLADINQVAATFRYSTTENINLLDVPLGAAWVKIDNTEGTTWTLIDNRQ